MDCPKCIGVPGYDYHTCGIADACDSVPKMTDADRLAALEAEVARLKAILDRALELLEESEFYLAAKFLRKEVDGE